MATYTLQEFLAQGGEKDVYRAVRQEDGEIVAVKMLRPRDNGKPQYTAEDKMRFATEVQRLQAAQGQGVAKILDSNVDDEPPFYVEEFFPEGTLAEKMQQRFSQGRTFSITTTLKRGEQILQALQRIHAGNQIHRDVKPANIMVQGDDIVLNDMGLGRTLDRPQPLQTQVLHAQALHSHSLICGTPGYAAPEQYQKNGQIDQRADVYAVGVILYEMLTGTRPTHYPVTFRNAKVEALLNKLLSPDKNLRFSNAGEVIRFIQQLSNGETSAPQPQATASAPQPQATASKTSSSSDDGGGWVCVMIILLILLVKFCGK